jgi:hypothetical protein
MSKLVNYQTAMAHLHFGGKVKHNGKTFYMNHGDIYSEDDKGFLYTEYLKLFCQRKFFELIKG